VPRRKIGKWWRAVHSFVLSSIHSVHTQSILPSLYPLKSSLPFMNSKRKLLDIWKEETNYIYPGTPPSIGEPVWKVTRAETDFSRIPFSIQDTVVLTTSSLPCLAIQSCLAWFSAAAWGQKLGHSWKGGGMEGYYVESGYPRFSVAFRMTWRYKERMRKGRRNKLCTGTCSLFSSLSEKWSSECTRYIAVAIRKEEES
jgi:hypothetical protein